jgi:hydrogenase maturation protease
MATNEPGRVHRIDLAVDPLPLGWSQHSSHTFGLAETAELARNLGRLSRNLVLYLIEGKGFQTGAATIGIRVNFDAKRAGFFRR